MPSSVLFNYRQHSQRCGIISHRRAPITSPASNSPICFSTNSLTSQSYQVRTLPFCITLALYLPTPMSPSVSSPYHSFQIQPSQLHPRFSSPSQHFRRLTRAARAPHSSFLLRRWRHPKEMPSQSPTLRMSLIRGVDTAASRASGVRRVGLGVEM